MFKKIIAWFTKGSKIARILQYIYNGLFIATKALNSAVNALQEIEPDKNQKVIALLVDVLDYSDKAMQALKQIIEWFGIDTKLAPEIILSEEERACSVISHSARLHEITDSIKKEI